MESLENNANGNVTGENAENFTDEMGRMVFLHQTEAGQAVIVFLSLQGVLIICANSLVFFLFATTRSLRTRTNYCLVSLAASDFLAGAVSIPMVLACNSTFISDVCTSMDLCQRFLSISTILHLLLATSERYFKITRPFKYNVQVTKRRVVILLLTVWAFSWGASFVQLAWINLSMIEDFDTIVDLDFGYAVFCLAALAFLPFIVIACIDGRIFYFIHNERKMRQALIQGKLQKQQKRKQNDRKVVVIYVAMTMTFVLGWFPYFIFTLLADLGCLTSEVPFAVHVAFIFLKFSTALINPLMYTFFKLDFRKALQAMLQPRDRGFDDSNDMISTTVV